MDIRQDERVAVFVDGQNFVATAKALAINVDFRKLIQFFREKCRLVRVFYYTPILEDQEFSPIRRLIDWLQYNGFVLVTKPAIKSADANGRTRISGSIGVELAIDAMRHAPRVDHIVLISGNGDFRALVETLKGMGVRVTVLSTLATPSAMVADELRRAADTFADLAELRAAISRDQ